VEKLGIELSRDQDVGLIAVAFEGLTTAVTVCPEAVRATLSVTSVGVRDDYVELHWLDGTVEPDPSMTCLVASEVEDSIFVRQKTHYVHFEILLPHDNSQAILVELELQKLRIEWNHLTLATLIEVPLLPHGVAFPSLCDACL